MSLFDILNAGKIKQQNEQLKNELSSLNQKLSELGYTEYAQTRVAIDKMNGDISEANVTIAKLRAELDLLSGQCETKGKQLRTATNKIAKSKELLKAVSYAIDNFFVADTDFKNCKLPVADIECLEELSPSVILKLNAMNVADLRKANNANNKQIELLLEQYRGRYTTKANKTIYALMVIALRAELQNILVQMKYEKLDKSIDTLKDVTAKYLAIASEGNQNIISTLTKFIGELEYLFINAIKIEYNYYVKKEQAKQEQLAIKAQMRQEAEERKALELEKKKVEKEEEKYNLELAKVEQQLQNSTDQSEMELLKKRLLELEVQLSNVAVKKEEITKLQNGKAGTVYIISNLGSFGEDVFKVGMTRRSEPMDRVNELGDASVPFRFDVHSFIFSDDAVGLEASLHRILDKQRLNKVNRRKEFFKTSIEELEKLVLEVQPTAEFNKTMIAEEFRQSLSSDCGYSEDFEDESDEEE